MPYSALMADQFVQDDLVTWKSCEFDLDCGSSLMQCSDNRCHCQPHLYRAQIWNNSEQICTQNTLFRVFVYVTAIGFILAIFKVTLDLLRAEHPLWAKCTLAVFTLINLITMSVFEDWMLTGRRTICDTHLCTGFYFLFTNFVLYFVFKSLKYLIEMLIWSYEIIE